MLILANLSSLLARRLNRIACLFFLPMATTKILQDFIKVYGGMIFWFVTSTAVSHSFAEFLMPLEKLVSKLLCSTRGLASPISADCLPFCYHMPQFLSATMAVRIRKDLPMSGKLFNLPTRDALPRAVHCHPLRASWLHRRLLMNSICVQKERKSGRKPLAWPLPN